MVNFGSIKYQKLEQILLHALSSLEFKFDKMLLQYLPTRTVRVMQSLIPARGHRRSRKYIVVWGQPYIIGDH